MMCTRKMFCFFVLTLRQSKEVPMVFTQYREITAYNTALYIYIYSNT